MKQFEYHKKVWHTIFLAVLWIGAGFLNSAFAQNESRTVEDGGTGSYKALMISEKTLPTHAVVFKPLK